MKYSIIEDLYYGGRGSYENVVQSEKHKELSKELSEKEAAFTKELSEQMQKKFDEIDNLQMGVESEGCLMYYKEGVKIGILLAMEAFLVD